MDDIDFRLQLQALRHDLALWKGRAVEAVETACMICRTKQDHSPDDCPRCRMELIRKDATK